MDKPNLDKAEAAKDLEALALKISAGLLSTISCKIALDSSDPEEPKLLIDDWVTIIISIKDEESTSFTGAIKSVIKYSISHKKVISSHDRMEPDDVDVIEVSETKSPWQALETSFKLILENDLQRAIESVSEENAEQERREFEAEMENSLLHKRERSEFKDLLDPL